MSKRGFTLIELLIVVAIIGILAAIAIPNFLEAQTRAKIARTMAEMKTVAGALAIYYVDNNNYIPAWPPETSKPWGGIAAMPLYARYASGYVTCNGQRLTSPVAYLSSVPIDPFASAGLGEYAIVEASYWYQSAWDVPYDHTINDAAAHGVKTYYNCGYALRACGPDHTFYENIPYDPTNGTISIGEPIYVGTDGFVNP